MNTFLSPAQQAAKDQYRSYVRERLQSKATLLEQRVNGSAESPLKDFLHSLGQDGYLGLHVPKEYGGQGASFLYVVFLAEALAAVLPALGLVLAEHNAVIESIKRFGTQKQKSLYLPLLARGECIGCTAFSEADAGTDFEAVKTTVAGGAVTGNKTWVANADIATLILVSARDTQDKLRLLLIDTPADSTSFSLGERHELLGMQAVSINSLTFNSHKVGQDACLEPDSDQAREQIIYAQNIGKTIIAATALGCVEAAMEISVDHANQREQFGQKIGQFQAIQWKLADMSTQSSACRLLTYRAAWDKDEDPDAFHKDAAMCKWYAARLAREHSGEAVEILGARGLLADSPLQRFYRDAKVMEICQGTAELQKIIIAEELGV